MDKFTNNNSSSRLWSGLIILGVGLVFFLRNVGLDIPHWVISWHTLLILIGLLVGYKRNFNGGGWLIMVLIGGFFTLEDITEFDLSKYYFAIAFIILGLYMIFRPKRTEWDRGRWKRRLNNRRNERFNDFTGFQETDNPKVYSDIDKDDIIDSINVFGGSHYNVYSKKFKGGDVIAIFGGSDINLTQADFEGTVVLDVVAIFGGLKIVIPPNWEVKSEVTAIFGGMDDKRGVAPVRDGEKKVIIIKGVALFGGVDIRNF